MLGANGDHTMTTEKPDMSVRDIAEKGVEKARDAVGFLLETARSTAEAVQANTKTDTQPSGVAVQRGFAFAKENITAIFDLAQKLTRAPDLKQAAQLQADFVKSQAAIIQKQVEELRSLKPEAETPAGPGDDPGRGDRKPAP